MSQDDFYEKEFRYGDSCIARIDLESCPAPFCTKDVSDETMKAIIYNVDCHTKNRLGLHANEHIDFQNDRHSEMWWKTLEHFLNVFNVPYYEDIDSK